MSAANMTSLMKDASSMRASFKKASMHSKVQVAISRIDEEVLRHEDLKPWHNLQGETIWNRERVLLGKLLYAQAWEMTMGCIVVLNVILIIYEADYAAQCYPDWVSHLDECPYNPDTVSWLYWTNMSMLMIYTADALAHLYVERRRFIYSKWNCLDTVVVVSGWLSLSVQDMVNVAWLRIFRTFRLIRAVRIVMSIRELYMLLVGMFSSFKAIFFGTAMLTAMLAIWSIVLVEFVHPLNSVMDYDGCERCPRGFGSVYGSMLTLFQTIIAGDSWGIQHVPLIEEHPWTAPVLVMIALSISLGMMNLILAVIVESAAEARDQDAEQRLKSSERDQLKMKKELLHICSEMDKDSSGTVSLTEMIEAWEENPDFRNVMVLLDVTKKELGDIYSVLDMDASGEVDYKEFVDQLYDLRTNDMRLVLALTRISVTECRRDIQNKVDKIFQELQSKGEERRSVSEANFTMLRELDRKIDMLCQHAISGSAADLKGVFAAANSQSDEVVAGQPDTSCSIEPCRADDQFECSAALVSATEANASSPRPLAVHAKSESADGAEQGDLASEAGKQVSVLPPFANIVGTVDQPEHVAQAERMVAVTDVPCMPSLPEEFATEPTGGVRESDQANEVVALQHLIGLLTRTREGIRQSTADLVAEKVSSEHILRHGGDGGEALQRSVQQRLAELMRQFRRCAEEQADAFAYADRLLCSLQGSSSCAGPLPPKAPQPPLAPEPPTEAPPDGPDGMLSTAARGAQPPPTNTHLTGLSLQSTL